MNMFSIALWRQVICVACAVRQAAFDPRPNDDYNLVSSIRSLVSGELEFTDQEITEFRQKSDCL